LELIIAWFKSKTITAINHVRNIHGLVINPYLRGRIDVIHIQPVPVAHIRLIAFVAKIVKYQTESRELFWYSL